MGMFSPMESMMSSDSETLVAKRLEGEVALITGGASGIGETITRLFVENGAKVLIADIQDELSHSLCEELGTPETISYVHCDVTSESDVEKAVDLAVSKYGKLDIMFDNTDIAAKQEAMAKTCASKAANRQAAAQLWINQDSMWLPDTTTGGLVPKKGVIVSGIDNFEKESDVNDFGASLVAKHAARVMKPAKKGCIIFMATIVSKRRMGSPYAYTTSKHDAVGWTEIKAVELAEYGIRVNCISPYVDATSMFHNDVEGTMLDANDVAEAALYLASADAKANGKNIEIPVDVGYCLNNQINLKDYFTSC